MKTGILQGWLVLLVLIQPSNGNDPNPANDTILEELRHQDMNIRIAALRRLHTTLDPRLPEALFKLLDDEGNSIRRLAARGIGSRYWQIPRKETARYVEKLRKNAKSEHYLEKEMAERAIGLLTRRYDGPMLSRSANGRWVVYERYSRPCLIDTRNGSEELLGWENEEYASYYPDRIDEEAGFTPWHPEKEIVALIVGLDRRTSTAWAWIHQQGLKRLDHNKVLAALGFKPEYFLGPGGFYTEHAGWKEDRIRLKCSFVVIDNPEQVLKGGEADYKDVEATVLWDAASGKVGKSE